MCGLRRIFYSVNDYLEFFAHVMITRCMPQHDRFFHSALNNSAYANSSLVFIILVLCDMCLIFNVQRILCLGDVLRLMVGLGFWSYLYKKSNTILQSEYVRSDDKQMSVPKMNKEVRRKCDINNGHHQCFYYNMLTLVG